MIKIFGYSLNVISSYVFNGITCYYFINLTKVLFSFSEEDVSSIQVYSGLIVAIFASIYWLIRGVNALMEIPFKRKDRKRKEKISELEEMLKRAQIMNEMTKEDIKKLLENDKHETT